MEERICAMMKIKKSSAAVVLAAAVLAAGVTAVFAASAVPVPAEPTAGSSIAYRDLNEAKTSEEAKAILDARCKIIYGDKSWTLDGAVKIINADGSVEELPDFYDLFPSDWWPHRLPEKSWEHRYAGSMNIPDHERTGLYSGNVYFSEVSADDEIYPFGCAFLIERGGDIGLYPESLPENAQSFTAGFYDEDRKGGIGWAASLSEGQGILLSDADYGYGTYGTRFGFIMSVPGSHEPGYGHVIVDYLDSGSFPVDVRLEEAAP